MRTYEHGLMISCAVDSAVAVSSETMSNICIHDGDWKSFVSGAISVCRARKAPEVVEGGKARNRSAKEVLESSKKVFESDRCERLVVAWGITLSLVK
jgi:hypothetical protein